MACKHFCERGSLFLKQHISQHKGNEPFDTEHYSQFKNIIVTCPQEQLLSMNDRSNAVLTSRPHYFPMIYLKAAEATNVAHRLAIFISALQK